MADRKLGGLYWELDLRAKGMDAGEAKATVSLAAVDAAAKRAQEGVESLRKDLAQALATKPDNSAAVKSLRQVTAEAESTAAAMTKLADTAASPGARVGVQFIEQLKKQLAQSESDIQMQLEAGLLSPRSAEAAGKQAAAAYTKSVREGLNSLRSQGVISTSDLPALYRRSADALNKTPTQEVNDLRAVETQAAKTTSQYASLREAQEAWLREAAKTPNRAVSNLISDADLARASKRFEQLVPEAGESGRKIAQKLTAGIERELSLKQAELRELTARGFVTPEEAAARGKAAAVSYNRNLIAILEKEGNAGRLDSARGQDTYVALANRLKNVDESAQRARVSIRGLREPLTTLATHAIGANSSVGTLVSQIATIGLGSGVTLAVVAGIAAIAAAYNKLTEKSREARKEVEQIIEKFKEQVKLQGRTVAEFNEQETTKEIERLQALISTLETRKKALVAAQDQGSTGTGASLALVESRLEQARKDLLETKATQGITSQALSDEVVASADKEARALAGLAAARKLTNKEQQLANDYLKAYRAEFAKLAKDVLSTDEKTRRSAVERRAEIQGIIESFERPDRAASAADERALERRRNAIAAFEQAIASHAQDRDGSFEVQLDRLVEQARKAKVSAAEISRYTDELRAAYAERVRDETDKLSRDLQARLVQETGSQADNLRAGLAKFREDIAKQLENGIGLDRTTFDALVDAQKHAIALADEAERFGDNIRLVDIDLETGTNLVSDLFLVQKEIADAEAARAAALKRYQAGEKDALKDVEAAQDRINKGKQRQATIQQQINAHTQNTAEKTAKIAGGIQAAANAAFGFASAIAGANSELARMIGGIGQIAGGVESIAKLASEKGGLGKLFSSGAGVLSALPGLGSIVGGGLMLGSALFGDDPEAQERLRIQKENTQAIKALTDRVGDLARINVTGTDVSRVKAALADPAVLALLAQQQANPLGASTDTLSRIFGDALVGQGLSYKDFAEFAKQLGITTDPNRIQFQNIRDVIEALNAAELTEFSDTLTGQLQRLDAAVKLFPDLKDPINQFDEFRKALTRIKGGGGILQETLDQFDLTTAEGVERAQAALQTLFTQMGSLTSDQLGGLTAQEFLDALLRVQDLVTQAPSAAGTGGFNVDRTITETTGSRLAAGIFNVSAFTERSALATEAMLALMKGCAPLAPIMPPPRASYAPTIAYSGGNITVTITGGIAIDMRGAGVSQPALLTDQIAAELAPKISMLLARDLRIARRAQGIV